MKSSLFLSLLLPASVLVGCDVEDNGDLDSDNSSTDMAAMQSQIDQLQDMVDTLQAQIDANADGIDAIDTSSFISEADLE